jgi:hypothetical protein
MQPCAIAPYFNALLQECHMLEDSPLMREVKSLSAVLLAKKEEVRKKSREFIELCNSLILQQSQKNIITIRAKARLFFGKFEECCQQQREQ